MGINLIWAQDESGLIGIRLKETGKFQMPWIINGPNKDLQYFKEKTEFNVVVMGYNTWLSLNRKPLNNRVNIILTSSHFDETLNYVHQQGFENVIVCDSKQSVLNEYHKLLVVDGLLELFVIGGTQLYYLFKDVANKFYKTIIHQYESYYKDSSMYDEIRLEPIITTKQYDVSKITVKCLERIYQPPFEWLVYGKYFE